VLGGDHQGKERVVARLGRAHAVVAERLDALGVGRDAGERELRRAGAGVLLGLGVQNSVLEKKPMTISYDTRRSAISSNFAG
jgi:hypothetical protein